jgi:regulatory protein
MSATREVISLRTRALALLARREHSRAELQRKLAPHTEDPQELTDLLDDLAQRGWLSDARFAEALVHDMQAKFGASRLAYELRERGVEESVIRDQLAELKDSELERAQQVWQSKFGVYPEDAKARAKQMRFLQSRGFSFEVIGKIMRGNLA